MFQTTNQIVMGKKTYGKSPLFIEHHPKSSMSNNLDFVEKNNTNGDDSWDFMGN